MPGFTSSATPIGTPSGVWPRRRSRPQVSRKCSIGSVSLELWRPWGGSRRSWIGWKAGPIIPISVWRCFNPRGVWCYAGPGPTACEVRWPGACSFSGQSAAAKGAVPGYISGKSASRHPFWQHLLDDSYASRTGNCRTRRSNCVPRPIFSSRSSLRSGTRCFSR